jgi:AraC-like DNA-binding protein
MPLLKLVSTESVNPSDRVGLFRHMLWEYFGRLESKVVRDRQFKASFEYARVGDVGFCRLRESGDHRVERTGSLAKRGDGFLKILLQIEGTGYFEQCGRRVQLLPNHWTICDTAKPYVVFVPNDAEFLLLVFPREKIISKCYNLDRLTVLPFSGSVGIGKLAWQFICSVFDEIPNLDWQSGSDIVDTIAHLLRLAMLQFSGNPTIGSQKQILRDRIKSYILAHLRDPELSIEQVAAALHCTKRYLHRAFELEEVSLSDYIWRLRLDRCREELLSRGDHDRSVTDIAFSWGFNSSAHFSTAFKNRFGISPSSYRRQRLGEGPAKAADRIGTDRRLLAVNSKHPLGFMPRDKGPDSI